MPIIYHASGAGTRLAEALAADDDLRSRLAGDVHFASLDGRTFYRFWRRPEAGDDKILEALIDDEAERPMEHMRGIIVRAFGEIEEVEV